MRNNKIIITIIIVIVIVIFSNRSFWNLFQKKHCLVFGRDPGFVGPEAYTILSVFFKKKYKKTHRIWCKALEETSLVKEPWSLGFISKGEQNM